MNKQQCEPSLNPGLMCIIPGNLVGETTSGCPSPSLGNGTNISMGYIEKKVNRFHNRMLQQHRYHWQLSIFYKTKSKLTRMLCKGVFLCPYNPPPAVLIYQNILQMSKPGTEVSIVVRNKRIPAVVSKMPFHPTNYFQSKV